MLKLRHLRYFMTVVESGSFSRAAATIRVAQPALSRRVSELEEIIGIEPLHRTARGVRPTAAGEVLYREATDILRQIEKLPGTVRSAGGDIEGTVSLGMSSTLASFLAGPFMEACRAAFPKVKLRLITGDSMLMKSRIDTNQLDLATIFEDEPTPGFARRPLFRQRLYLIRRDPLADNAAAVSIDRLADIPVVLPAQPNVTRILLDRVFADAGVVPNMVAEADVLSSMLSAVQTGMGDTILPKGDLSDVPGHGALLPVPIEPAIFLTASILSSNDVPLSRTAALVHDLFSSFVFQLMAAVPPPGAEWIGGDPVMPGGHMRMPT